MKKIFIICFLIFSKCTHGQLILINSIFSNPSFFITDNFNAYANGELNGQGNWTIVRGSISVINGTVTGNTSNGEACIRRTEIFNSNQYSQKTLTTLGETSFIGPAVRCSNDINYYAYYAGLTGRYLFKVVNGVSSDIGYTSSATNSINDVLRLEIVGSTLRCYRNGMLDTALSGGTGIFTDTSLTTGTPGFATYGDLGTTTGDNWIGGNL